MEKINNSKTLKTDVLLNMFPAFDEELDENIINWFANGIAENYFNIFFENAANKRVVEWLIGLEKTFKKCAINPKDLHHENFGIREETNLPVFFDYADYYLVNEQNALGTGNIAGYTAPLGAPGIGSSNKLEKGFWRDKAGKKIKTGSPDLDKDIKEMVQAINTPQDELNLINGLWQGQDILKVKTTNQELHESFAMDYFYHGTNADGIHGMKKSGFLKTFKPWHRTDQQTWPDGAVEKRAYFSPLEKGVEPFFPEFGPYFVLRVPKTAAVFKPERSTGDWFVRKPISIKNIEFFDKQNNSWKPIKLFGEEEKISLQEILFKNF